MPGLSRRATVLSLVLCAAVGSARAAPKAEPWPRWQAHRPGAAASVDHGAWGRLLGRYLRPGGDGINRVAYGAVTAADRQALEQYVAALAATPVSSLDRPEQRAFWSNLYNALTVQVVLSRYPVRSIRDIAISPGLFASGPWGKKLVTVEGEALCLDDIEHRILRPIWRDPRTHYAVNCAALGCPNLWPEPFTAGNLETVLEQAAAAYVNHPRGVRPTLDGLRLSSLYDWYGEDFGDLPAHLRRYAAPPLAAALRGGPRIAGYGYDWALNDAGGSAG